MKKLIAFILLLSILVLNIDINATTYEEEIKKLKPMDLDEVINSIYWEFGLLYNKEEINMNVLETYRVPVIGNPVEASEGNCKWY